MFTVLVGAAFLCLFPKSPSDPVSLLGFRYFTEREAHILSHRVLLDDPRKIHKRQHISKQEIKNAVCSDEPDTPRKCTKNTDYHSLPTGA